MKFEPKFKILKKKGNVIEKVKLEEISLVKKKRAVKEKNNFESMIKFSGHEIGKVKVYGLVDGKWRRIRKIKMISRDLKY